MPRTADYAVSIVLVVAACFIYWIWKVTSAGGTIGDGIFVAFTWAIPAVIAAIAFTRISSGYSKREKKKHLEPSPPPEKKPETGIGSAAWEVNRLREIRELREEERKKSAEWHKSQVDTAEE